MGDQYYYKFNSRGEIEEVYAFDPRTVRILRNTAGRNIAVFSAEEPFGDVLYDVAITEPFHMPVSEPHRLKSEGWLLVNRGKKWTWQRELRAYNILPQPRPNRRAK